MTDISGSQVFGGDDDTVTVKPNLDLRNIEFVFETYGGDLGGPSRISFNVFVNGKLAQAVNTTLNTSINQWASGTYSLDVVGAVSSMEIVLVAGWIAPKSLTLTTSEAKQSFSVLDGAQTSATRPSWAQQGWLVQAGEKLSYQSVGIAASQIQVDGGAGIDVLVVDGPIESTIVQYGDGVVTLTTKSQGTIVANNFESFKFSNSTVSLTEIQTNRAPSFANSLVELSVLSTASKSVSLAAVDPDGDKLIYSIATPATNGEASIVNGQLLYTPGKVGTNDTLQVAVRDKFGAIALQTFNFAVNPGTDKLSFTYKSTSQAMEMQRVGSGFVDNPLWQECTSWVVDLNGDGIDEILLLPSIYNISLSTLGGSALDALFHPRVLQVVDGKFTEVPVNVSFTIGQVNELLAADFDGDGKVELFFVDQGLEDQSIDSGKSQSGGYLRYIDVSFDGKSYTFSDKNADLDLAGQQSFWHEGALIDRNGDGVKEIALAAMQGVNNNSGQPLNYKVQGKTDATNYPGAFFLNNSNGKLLAAGDQLAPALKSNQADGFWSIGTVGAGDLDGNGKDEAIFVRYVNYNAAQYGRSDGQDIIIWWDNGTTTTLPLPKLGSATDPSVYTTAYAGGKTTKVFDANGDGRNDILIRWEGSGGKGTNISQLIQLFIQKSDGSFEDQTLASFGGYNLIGFSELTADWPYVFFGQGIKIADVNGDGSPDLYFNGSVNFGSAQDYLFWLNDGLGHFAPTKLNMLNKEVGAETWGADSASVKSLLGNFDSLPGLDLAVFYFEQPNYGATPSELKDDKFLVDLYSGQTFAATQAQLSQVRGYRATLADGGKGEFGGSGTIFGSKGAQEILVADKAATVVLDPSFNLGGDVLRLSKSAASYTVKRSGSTALISDSDTSVTVPIGTKGMTIAFADGNRTLVYANGQFKLGDQVFSDAAVKITAQSEGAVGAYSLASVQSTVVVNDSAPSILGGNLAVFGSKTGKETIKLSDGAQKVTLDASWNSGGDILVLPKAGSSYTIAKSGSVVTLSAESQTITVPVGIAGMTLRFTDGDRVLFYDTKDQSFKLSEQIITATANKVSELSQVISLDSSIYQSSVKTIDAGPMNYRFVDDPTKASSVVIEHAYVGDVLQLSATQKDKYEIKNIGNDLFVNLSVNNVVSQVLVKDVIPNGKTVTDLASLTEALKWTDGTWNFLTFG